MTIPEKPAKKDFNLKPSRRQKDEKIAKLTDYHKNYSLETFMEDLGGYFDNEIDFNLAKIRQEIEKSQRLENLIQKANQKNTHPVTEFIQELFEDLGQSGGIEWSGDW